MKRDAAPLRWMVLAVVSALVLVACGGESESPDSASTDVEDNDSDATDGEEDTEPAEQVEEGEEQAREGPPQELIEEAQAEGSVLWYGSLQDPIPIAAGEAFTEEFGIEVEYVGMSTPDVSARFLGELEAGVESADLILRNQAEEWFWVETIEDGFILSPEAAGVPDWPGEFPADFLAPDTGIPAMTMALVGIMYNTDLVGDDEVPQTWDDLLDPRWENEIIVTAPTGGPGQLVHWDIYVDRYGEEWIEGIGQQLRAYYESSSQTTQAVAAGEAAIGMPTSASHAVRAQEDGAPVELHIPDYTSGSNYGLGISAEAPNPAAARLFAWWVLVGPGTEVMAEVDPNAIVVGHAGSHDKIPPEYQNYRPGFADDGDRLIELLIGSGS